ncbi:hypothetical protein BGZ99_009657 [Dissophora globulifera]|uniref:Uncharacterized protein n=1 Tax=Dissophora globulifera TaxID=979702 RepID=A0A9P6R6D0_9FUNG|nr:hypothetical protein BGZ99_009657 [Dissophora globulifera]
MWTAWRCGQIIELESKERLTANLEAFGIKAITDKPRISIDKWAVARLVSSSDNIRHLSASTSVSNLIKDVFLNRYECLEDQRGANSDIDAHPSGNTYRAKELSPPDVSEHEYTVSEKCKAAGHTSKSNKKVKKKPHGKVKRDITSDRAWKEMDRELVPVVPTKIRKQSPINMAADALKGTQKNH